MKTVVFLCGLIGSGKTTYAKSRFRYFTDLDYMPQFSRKLDQINWTHKLLRISDEVCHITCYPTLEELTAFRLFEKKLLWMNTSVNQAKTNILVRNRQRDMANIFNVFQSNAELQIKYQNHSSAFELINNYGRDAPT